MGKNAYAAFWGEMSAFEHFVQIYENEPHFLDTLADYTYDGLSKGEAAIAILTPRRRDGLETRLLARNINITAMQLTSQLILLDAQETLSKFMVDDWPDEAAFHNIITSTLKRAAGPDTRKVRAFGEMVALMWAEGKCAATVRLEHLWHDLCKKEQLPLFCAYPKTGFSTDPHESITHICALHSKVLEA